MPIKAGVKMFGCADRNKILLENGLYISIRLFDFGVKTKYTLAEDMAPQIITGNFTLNFNFKVTFKVDLFPLRKDSFGPLMA